MASVQKQVEELLKMAGVTEPPIPVERLARLCSAQIRYSPFEGAVSGFLYRDQSNIIIGVNSLHSGRRQRFTIAHELGHLRLHDCASLYVDRGFIFIPRNERSSQAIDVKEVEANRFAAALLMPAPWLKRDFKSFQIDSIHYVDYEDDILASKLADRYQVSLQAMIIRLTNLGLISRQMFESDSNL